MGNAEIKPTNNFYIKRAPFTCPHALIEIEYPVPKLGIMSRFLTYRESVEGKRATGVYCDLKRCSTRKFKDEHCVFEITDQDGNVPTCPYTDPLIQEEYIIGAITPEKIRLFNETVQLMKILGERFREDNKGK